MGSLKDQNKGALEEVVCHDGICEVVPVNEAGTEMLEPRRVSGPDARAESAAESGAMTAATGSSLLDRIRTLPKPSAGDPANPPN